MAAPGQVPPTVQPVLEAFSLERIRRARLFRRIVLLALVVYASAGVTGLLGVREGTVSASGGGYELTVTYGAVTRPGLATPWTAEVRRRGGLGDEPIRLRTTSAYFEIFDEISLDPEPSSATSDATTTVWEFDPPAGEVLVVDFDARAGPAYLGGRTAETEVMAADGPAARVAYRTRVLP